MKILRARKLKSETRFYVEAEDKEINLILVEGIRRFIKENNFVNIIVTTDEIDSGMLGRVKKWDLSDAEEQYLLNIGFSSIICESIGMPFPNIETFEKFLTPRRKSKTIFDIL